MNNRVDKHEIRFVSLDDDYPLEKYKEQGIEDCLIRTRFFCNELSEGGLQQEHVDKAIKILRGVTNDNS